MDANEAKRQADELRRAVGLPVGGRRAAQQEADAIRRWAAQPEAAATRRWAAQQEAAAIRLAAAQQEADAVRRACGLPTYDEQLELDKRAVKAGAMTPDDFLVKHGEPVKGCAGCYWLTTIQRIEGKDLAVRKIYRTRAAVAEIERQQERLLDMLAKMASAFERGSVRVDGMAGGLRVSNLKVRA